MLGVILAILIVPLAAAIACFLVPGPGGGGDHDRVAGSRASGSCSRWSPRPRTGR